MAALTVRDGSGVDEIGKIAEATLWRVWDAKLRNLDLIMKEMKSQICLNSLVSPHPTLFSWPCSMESLCCRCHLPPNTQAVSVPCG